MYQTEEYVDPGRILYRHVLTAEERRAMADIIHVVLNQHRGLGTSVPFVRSQLSKLQGLYDELQAFFETRPGGYFIRLSTLSPKDAYYQLFVDTPSAAEAAEDEAVTLADIKRDLAVLRVSSAEQALLVMTHSERVYFEVEFDRPNAVLLMPWMDNILTDTETRCFVRGRKMVTFTQYYADLPSGYASVPFDAQTFYTGVCDFIQSLLETIPYEDCVIDIALSDPSTFLFIEINPLNHNTDAGLFEWDELDQLNGPRPVFKYKRDGQVMTVTGTPQPELSSNG